MDSLSFTFLGFASYTVALLVNAPLYRKGLDLRLLDTARLRRSPRVWVMAALFMVMIDLVVDPLSVRGERWFLGKLFWYDPPGPHFGVPISNYLGWFFIAAIAVACFKPSTDGSIVAAPSPSVSCQQLIGRALMGPLLYAGIVCFGITMLFVIGASEIGWASIFIFLPFLTVVLSIITRASNYGDEAAIASHLADFPFNAPYIQVPEELPMPHRSDATSLGID